MARVSIALARQRQLPIPRYLAPLLWGGGGGKRNKEGKPAASPPHRHAPNDSIVETLPHNGHACTRLPDPPPPHPRGATFRVHTKTLAHTTRATHNELNDALPSFRRVSPRHKLDMTTERVNEYWMLWAAIAPKRATRHQRIAPGAPNPHSLPTTFSPALSFHQAPAKRRHD